MCKKARVIEIKHFKHKYNVGVIIYNEATCINALQ